METQDRVRRLASGLPANDGEEVEVRAETAAHIDSLRPALGSRRQSEREEAVAMIDHFDLTLMPPKPEASC